MNEMHHEPAHTPASTEPTTDPSTSLPVQLTLDLPEVETDDDGTIDLQRFRLDEHTRELGRRQVALIKAQLAERAAQRTAA